MAKAYYQKARKQYTCSKCGSIINPKEGYYKIGAMYQSTKHRCERCKPERSELTGSEYYSWLWDLQDHLEERYDIRSEEGIEELVSDLNNQKDELEDRLSNMPDQLQYSETGEMLQGRIDAIESAIDDLESIEFPDPEDDYYKLDEEDKEGLTEDEIDDQEQDKYNEALDDVESAVIDAINSIE